ncbi:MAG: hypothetical protein JSW27_10525, partial [Phycisphaerales bacterium]
MKTADTFLGWRACGREGAWTIDEGNDYPRLWWGQQAGEIMTGVQLVDLLSGVGTADDPFLIFTAQEMNSIGL